MPTNFLPQNIKVEPRYILYVGTTKIALLKTLCYPNGMKRVVSFGACPAEGFEYGIVKDISKSSETLRSCSNHAMGQSNETLIPCRVVLSNSFMKNFTFASSIYFYGNSHALTMKDVREVIAQTRSVATIPLNEMIIQSLPQEFLVDDMTGITNPIGLEATRLGVTLRLFTTDYPVYHNLVRAMERADLDAKELVPVSLAAAHAVLTPEEIKEGVILADIGGHATHIDCYKNSVLVASRSIAFGSEIITQELSKCFNLKTEEARRLKETFASASPKDSFSEELIPMQAQEKNPGRHITRKEFQHELQKSMNEFMTTLAMQLCSIASEHSPVTQIVFTGGGAKLDGFLEAIQEHAPYSLRIGLPRNVEGPQELLTDPSFSGAVGAIDYSSMVMDSSALLSGSNNFFSKTISATKQWFSEYF